MSRFGQYANVLPRVLAEHFWYGILIDHKQLDRFSSDLSRELELSKIWWSENVGGNIGSTQQRIAGLYDKLLWPTEGAPRTDTGALSTDRNAVRQAKLALEEGSLGYVAAEKLERHSKLSKLYSAYVVATLEHLRHRPDGRMRPEWKGAKASTGRILTSNPNFQSLPRSPKEEGLPDFRRVVRAAPGYKLIGADYDSLEVKVVAHLSGDPLFKKMLDEGLDFHTLTADLLNIPRHTAKTVNYAKIYHAGPISISYALNLPVTQHPKGFLMAHQKAKEISDAFDETYRGVTEYNKLCIMLARNKGYAETLAGRRIPVFGISSLDKSVRKHAENAACNAPVQGSAADITTAAVCSLYLRWKRKGFGDAARIIANVHDEILCEVREDIAEECRKDLEDCMQGSVKLKFPLTAEAKVGSSWAEIK